MLELRQLVHRPRQGLSITVLFLRLPFDRVTHYPGVPRTVLLSVPGVHVLVLLPSPTPLGNQDGIQRPLSCSQI